MTDRGLESLWLGGFFVGATITRALGHRFPTASIVAFGATAVWFVGGLIVDNLRFRREVAEQRQRLAERKAAFRAARDAARRAGPDEPGA
jgi:hypothetical protein